MSVLLEINNLSDDMRRKLVSDLTVKTVINKKGKKGKIYQKNDQFEMYEIINDTHVSIPFAYYYQHFNKFPNQEKEFPKIEATFNIELFDRQKELRQESLEILNDTHSLLLALSTGYGKTFYFIYLACKMKLKTIILDNRVILTGQWEKSIKTACGKDTKIQILSSTNKLDPDADFYIINPINVPKRDRKDFEHIGILCLEECHLLSTEKNSRAIFSIHPKYVVALSATPVRSDGKDRAIELVAGHNMIQRSLNALFNVYLFHTNFIPKVKKNENGDMNWNSALESQATNEDRNNIIVKLCKYFAARNILVLCKRKDHVNILYEMMSMAGLNVETFMGSKKIIDYDCRILIATYSKSGVGFDFPKLDMLIVAGDVEESWLQYLGRIFRREYNFPIVVDLVDKFRPFKNHSDSRIELCKECGGMIKNFEKYFSSFYTLI